jgi:hypothetical protein
VFTLGKLCRAHIVPVHEKQVKRKEAGLTTPEQKIIQFRPAFTCKADDLAIEHSPLVRQ